MRIIGYTYCAAYHCPECASNDAAVGILKREPPLRMSEDEHGLTDDLIDREGNTIHRVYSIDEMGDSSIVSCDDCHCIIYEKE